jgi:hypothetical protein
VRHAVVLENDCFLDMVEDPADSSRWSTATAKIDVRVVLHDVAVPVHPLHGVPCVRALLGVEWLVATRAVGHQQELFRPSGGDLREHLGREIGAIEENEGDGSLQRPREPSSRDSLPLQDQVPQPVPNDVDGIAARLTHPSVTRPRRDRRLRSGSGSEE